MISYIKLSSIVLILLIVELVSHNRAEQFGLQSSGNERAIRYKPKANSGPTTSRPTWRPVKLEKEKHADGDDDPEAEFPNDYYDNYDGELEGTRRNIFLHNTFEERMKTYNKLMQSQSKNNKATQDILQKTLKVAKEEQKKRNAAKKVVKKPTSRKSGSRALDEPQKVEIPKSVLSGLLA